MKVVINQANLKNDHIYLNAIISFFPKDSIGGNNLSTKGRDLKISYSWNGVIKSFESDIAGDKKILRKRGKLSGTGMLLTDMDVKVGDTLEFKKIDDYHFEVIKIS
ncbi:hypothetical protein G9F31_06725 [Acinetobacter sp. 187]|uniref:hypothetical protein n=1 Tax=Acinetobacter lanii TaxID=2715163 RepID=UPI001408FBFD|nr:hypothetical protein [Acinetobacter lanii]NHC03462.1 hypothetical protein [Acinetobacter lanii]